MNGRIKLADIRDYLSPMSISGIGDIHVGTCYDRQYVNDYAELFPAVWIAGQKLTPADQGRGFSGHFSQNVNVVIPFRIVISRYTEGRIDAESVITTIFDELADRIKDWTPPGARSPFVWQQGQDGPATESLLVADQHFKTVVKYQRSI